MNDRFCVHLDVIPLLIEMILFKSEIAAAIASSPITKYSNENKQKKTFQLTIIIMIMIGLSLEYILGAKLSGIWEKEEKTQRP